MGRYRPQLNLAKEESGMETESRSPYYHEEETDLRQYISVLMRHWWLILIFVMLAAMAAFLVSRFQARMPTYEATALVVMGKPRLVLDLDPRIKTSEEITISENALKALATSDEVMRQLLSELEESLPGERLTLKGLKGMLTATVDRRGSLVVLTAHGKAPELVAQVVNTWARIFVTHVNRVYGVSEDVAFFQKQADRIKEEWDKAEEKLIAYQARNELPMLQAKYESLISLQAKYLAEQRRIKTVLQDVQTLQAQLSERPETASLTLDDQLAVLGLSLKSLKAEAESPVQLQVNEANVLTGRSVAEALTYLERLQENLQAKLADLDKRLIELKPSLQELQKRIEALRAEQDRLEQARDLARETYYMVARKVEEARIVDEDVANRARVVSTAEVPSRPAALPSILQNTVLGAVLGLLAGLGAAFLLEYMSGEPRPVEMSEGALASRRVGR